MRERQGLIDAQSTHDLIANGLRDNVELIEMGEAEGDAEIITEAEAALKALVELSAQKELEALLDGEADGNDTFLEINAGARGTESCDWASMLARRCMCDGPRGGAIRVEMQSETAGEEAGIRSVSQAKISGKNAYGWLKSEAGVHRLVRISPYDSCGAAAYPRSSSVWVYPVVDDNIEIDVQDKDIRIDTYRSSGAGGQARQARPISERCGSPLSCRHRCDIIPEIAEAPEPRYRDAGPEVAAVPAGVGQAQRGHP